MAAVQHFSINYQGTLANVTEHSLKNGRVFYITFNKPISKPLVITVAEDIYGKKFWTSLPEGRQHEAETVGYLVACYIRNHR